MQKSEFLSDERFFEQIGITPGRLLTIVERIKDHYRTIEFDDQGKTRVLNVPGKQLKTTQRRISKLLSQAAPPDDHAFCHQGRGPLRAARCHARHPYLLRLDVRDFFPNIRVDRVRRAVDKLSLSAFLKQCLAEIVCYDGKLPQGAPTSVAVSNLVMKPLDRRISGLCTPKGLTYTRYVDDIAISGGRRVANIEATVRKIVRDEGWELNEGKSELLGPGERRRYLGVVLNSHPSVIKDYRQALWWAMKRISRRGQPVPVYVQRSLLGRIAFIRAVHPPHAVRLQRAFAEFILPLGTAAGPAPLRPRHQRRKSDVLDPAFW